MMIFFNLYFILYVFLISKIKILIIYIQHVENMLVPSLYQLTYILNPMRLLDLLMILPNFCFYVKNFLYKKKLALSIEVLINIIIDLIISNINCKRNCENLLGYNQG